MDLVKEKLYLKSKKKEFTKIIVYIVYKKVPARMVLLF